MLRFLVRPVWCAALALAALAVAGTPAHAQVCGAVSAREYLGTEYSTGMHTDSTHVEGWALRAARRSGLLGLLEATASVGHRRQADASSVYTGIGGMMHAPYIEDTPALPTRICGHLGFTLGAYRATTPGALDARYLQLPLGATFGYAFHLARRLAITPYVTPAVGVTFADLAATDPAGGWQTQWHPLLESGISTTAGRILLHGGLRLARDPFDVAQRAFLGGAYAF